MSDDAYITLRTIDNFWNGYGLRWNAVERVQAYTHPLWLMLVGAAYGVTREPYLTTLAVALACTMGAAAILVARIASTMGAALVALACLLGSKAFVEFSTAGLENPLSHLLLAWFCWEAWRGIDAVDQRQGHQSMPAAASVGGPRAPGSFAHASTAQVRRLSLIAGLCALTRLDLLLLVGPLLGMAIVRVLLPTRRNSAPGLEKNAAVAAHERVHITERDEPGGTIRRSAAIGRAVIVGLLPLVAWELFSLLYYGFAFPNTAYAKLATGVARGALVAQGWFYLRDSLIADPVTLPVIALAIVWSIVRSIRRGGSDAIVAVSLAGSLLYLVSIGGDFMSGRFLTPAFVIAVAWLCRTLPFAAPSRAIVIAAGITLVSVCSPQSPWRFWHEPRAGDPLVTHGRGIIDERAVYYPSTGLIPYLTGRGDPARHSWAASGTAWRPVPRVVVFEAVGLLGYYGGPGLHVIDPMALTDPLLARRPASSWRIGHFQREVPEGYVATVERCLAIVFPQASVSPNLTPCVSSPDRRNAIRDPQIAALYDRLALITQGPIFDARRLRAIIDISLGR